MAGVIAALRCALRSSGRSCGRPACGGWWAAFRPGRAGEARREGPTRRTGVGEAVGEPAPPAAAAASGSGGAGGVGGPASVDHTRHHSTVKAAARWRLGVGCRLDPPTWITLAPVSPPQRVCSDAIGCTGRERQRYCRPMTHKVMWP